MEAPKCGVPTTLGWLGKSQFVGGSLLYTSTAAIATFPESSAAIKSASFTSAPRAQLTITTPSLHRDNFSLLIIFSVSGILGAWMVIISERFNKSSKLTSSIPIRSAISCVKIGSYPSNLVPNAESRLATSRPTLPRPTTPMVFSNNSWPIYVFRSHLPSRIELLACGIFRRAESINAMVCSVAAMVLPPGVFITMIPRRVASAVSILSTPAPARPITFNRVPFSITSGVTLVRLRTTNPSYWGKTSIKSSLEIPALLSTATSSRVLYCSKMWEGNESAIKIRYISVTPSV